MANQITHIVLAKRALTKLGVADERTFLMGTTFPDIRYLKVITREKTHFGEIDLAGVAGEQNVFRAGMKYHSFVDHTREEFVINSGIYDAYGSNPYVVYSLKFFEDEMFYSEIGDWQGIAQYYDAPHPEELSFNIREDAIQRWHLAMQNYFAVPPTDASRIQFITDLGLDPAVATEINKLVAQLRDDQKARDLTKNLLAEFDKLLA